MQEGMIGAHGDARLRVEEAGIAAPRDIPRDPTFDVTAALFLDPYRYVMNRCRALGTDVFEARLMGRRTIFMMGREAVRTFYDSARFVRKDAAPLRIVRSLFGVGGVQTLDGAEHREHKRMLMSLMTPARMDRLEEITRLEWLQSEPLGRPGAMVALYDVAREVLTRAACAWAGVPLLPSEVEVRARQLTALFDGAAAVGPRHWSARAARFSAEAWLARLVKEARAGRLELRSGTALHTIAFYRDPDGDLLDAQVAAVETLNILRPTVAVAVYITFVAHALHVYDAAREAASDGAFDPLVDEVRRFYPFIPAVAARVWHDHYHDGYPFPAGRRVVLDLYGTSHDGRIWEAPNEFRPQRFLRREPGPFDLVPQGGGDHFAGHRCAGEWVTRRLMRIAAEVLHGRLAYEVPAQDLSIEMTRLPALPRSRFILKSPHWRA